MHGSAYGPGTRTNWPLLTLRAQNSNHYTSHRHSFVPGPLPAWPKAACGPLQEGLLRALDEPQNPFTNAANPHSRKFPFRHH